MKTNSPIFDATFIVYCLLLAFLAGPAFVKKPVLKTGHWRAKIERQDGKNIVFNMQTKDSAGKTIFYVINGAERILVDSLVLKNDSLFIEMPFFESRFRAKILPDGNLRGVWIKQYGTRTQILPFEAECDVKYRFEASKEPRVDVSGKWMTTFTQGDGRKSNIVAEFKQQGSQLTGTFLDPTGDFRFLAGVVSGDSLKLSTFDGAHAFLFTAKIKDAHSIVGGKFYSGATSVEDWHAEKDAEANAEAGYTGTQLKPGENHLDFRFPDSNDSTLISINDARYRGKVVVVQILGSWCPNCMDETKFLSDYYHKNHSKGFDIIGLAYERTSDFAESQKALAPFKKRLNVQYPVLITGVTVSDPAKAEKTLPQLQSIAAFPTTIFIDKSGKVRKIESGFSGPATGTYYQKFKENFNKTIDALLAEKP